MHAQHLVYIIVGHVPGLVGKELLFHFQSVKIELELGLIFRIASRLEPELFFLEESRIGPLTIFPSFIYIYVCVCVCVELELEPEN